MILFKLFMCFHYFDLSNEFSSVSYSETVICGYNLILFGSQEGALNLKKCLNLLFDQNLPGICLNYLDLMRITKAEGRKEGISSYLINYLSHCQWLSACLNPTELFFHLGRHTSSYYITAKIIGNDYDIIFQKRRLNQYLVSSSILLCIWILEFLSGSIQGPLKFEKLLRNFCYFSRAWFTSDIQTLKYQ